MNDEDKAWPFALRDVGEVVVEMEAEVESNRPDLSDPI